MRNGLLSCLLLGQLELSATREPLEAMQKAPRNCPAEGQSDSHCLPVKNCSLASQSWAYKVLTVLQKL